MVRVPVLSITRAFTRQSCSTAVASFTRMPFVAALPMPTMRAVGVASPMAHGQAITSTEIAARTASGSTAIPPATSHTASVNSDKRSTHGTNTRATLSTNRCTGAFEPCACCTMRMMPESTVCCPTCPARKRNVPSVTMVPASTFAPFRLPTGTGSPEIMASST